MITVKDDGYRKIHFKLEKDEDGYPPDEWESVWAIEEETGRYKVDSIPFFIKGLSTDDVISASTVDGELHFKEIVRPSGNSILRVVVYDASVEQLRHDLQQLNCETELCNIPGFFSVEVPASVDIRPVLDFLLKGENEGRWEYEEASVRHPA